jgi:hypothetical protein
MTINEASEFLNSLIAETDKKSEIKVYQNFLGILAALNNKELTPEELRSIDEELELLKLKEYPENKKKYLKQKLNEFKKYLKAESSFISEGYYTAIGLSLGMCFGVAPGISVFGPESGVALGISFGMIIGLIIGRIIDSKAEKHNRVLKTKLFL